MDMKNIADELQKLLQDNPGSEEMIATIKAKSPTKVFNYFDEINQERPHEIIGTSILINGFKEYREIKFDDTTFTVPAVIDEEDLRPNSILFITDNQKMEISMILDGALTLLIVNGVIDKEDAFTIICEVLNLDTCIMVNTPYITFRESEMILSNIGNNNPKAAQVINNIITLLRFGWFIPYGALDDIYNEIVSQFQQSISNEDKGDKDE
jgi:hypothetical protein